MGYTPIGWQNGTGNTLNADNFKHIEDGILSCVSKDGDTMTGSLILKGEPTEDNEAATKKYVEDYINDYINKNKDYTLREYTVEIPSGKNGEFVCSIEIEGAFNYLIPIGNYDWSSVPDLVGARATTPQGTAIRGSLISMKDGESFDLPYMSDGDRIGYETKIKRSKNKLYFGQYRYGAGSASINGTNFSFLVL